MSDKKDEKDKDKKDGIVLKAMLSPSDIDEMLDRYALPEGKRSSQVARQTQIDIRRLISEIEFMKRLLDNGSFCGPGVHDLRIMTTNYFKRIPGTDEEDRTCAYASLFCTKCAWTKEIVAADYRGTYFTKKED